MRKSELRINATISLNQRNERIFTIYKSSQYRYSDDMCDPKYQDIEYHFSLETATKIASEIKTEVGYTPIVDAITFSYDDFNETFEFSEEFELYNLIDKLSVEIETVYLGDENMGNSLDSDGIIVFYNHHRYMNYAYSINSVKFVHQTNYKYDSELIQDRDSTNAEYCVYFDSIDELAEAWEEKYYVPFNKINSGSKRVTEFLEENHPDYKVEEEEENEE